MKIQKRTIRRLRTAASKYFSNEQDYRSFLAGWGVQSTLDLTDKQGFEAIQTIDRLQKERRQTTWGNRPTGAGKRLSFEQAEYIRGLFMQLQIPTGPRQFAFIAKQIGTPKAPDWLSPQEATKVITGLRNYHHYKNS